MRGRGMRGGRKGMVACKGGGGYTRGKQISHAHAHAIMYKNVRIHTHRHADTNAYHSSNYAMQSHLALACTFTHTHSLNIH